MKKIIQITDSVDQTLCLTEDGKVYRRAVKDKQEITEEPTDKYPHGKTYIKGTYYWKEILEEESF